MSNVDCIHVIAQLAQIMTGKHANPRHPLAAARLLVALMVMKLFAIIHVIIQIVRDGLLPAKMLQAAHLQAAHLQAAEIKSVAIHAKILIVQVITRQHVIPRLQVDLADVIHAHHANLHLCMKALVVTMLKMFSYTM